MYFQDKGIFHIYRQVVTFLGQSIFSIIWFLIEYYTFIWFEFDKFTKLYKKKVNINTI